MPTNLITAYNTLEREDQKLVEQLIYSLFEKVKNKNAQIENIETEENLLSTLQSLNGILKDCKYSTTEEAKQERLAEKYGV